MNTNMYREIHEIPEAVSRLLAQSGQDLKKAGRRLRQLDPAVLVTIARGTSDHAASFLKYAVELQAGVPVASLGPSLASIYERPLKLEGTAALAISQSGKSPDIVALAEMASKAGALSIGLLNTVPSPLSGVCTAAIDLVAGPEQAVAATKSYFSSVAAGLLLLAEWTQDQDLTRALSDLPEQAAKALDLDWSELGDQLVSARSIYCLGRGPSLAVAGEAALKCKETSQLHAEAYSTAEVLHGPVSLVSERFPLLVFAARDAAGPSVDAVADHLADKSALVFTTSRTASRARPLPRATGSHPLTDALLQIVPYYKMVERLSRLRHLDPDSPAALQKVTQTL